MKQYKQRKKQMAKVLEPLREELKEVLDKGKQMQEKARGESIMCCLTSFNMHQETEDLQ